MEQLICILEKIKPGVDFRNVKGIIDNNILDSLSIVRLVTEIDRVFDVEIPVTELLPENFNSVEAIMNLINKLEEE